ncbi:MAG: carboxypeptidase regulatory-like domain-containing protein [Planctomycetes bacterium]|nr:carboxypeptidase regulatory-like domain-containing protein [Planctomycetota bacterium]
MSFFRALALAFAASIIAGCSADERTEVTGTVTLKGTPLKNGTISFEPLDGQKTRATAVIAGGAFGVPRESGLVPGKYLVRVSAGDGKTAVNPVNPDNPPGPGGGTNIISKELVPADWNVNSKQERTVSKEGPNRFEIVIP